MSCLPSARSPKAAVSFETTILTSDSPGYLLFGATSTLKDATNIILEMENDLKTTMIFSLWNIAKGISDLGVTYFRRTQKWKKSGFEVWKKSTTLWVTQPLSHSLFHTTDNLFGVTQTSFHVMQSLLKSCNPLLNQQSLSSVHTTMQNLVSS